MQRMLVDEATRLLLEREYTSLQIGQEVPCAAVIENTFGQCFFVWLAVAPFPACRCRSRSAETTVLLRGQKGG